MSHPLRTVRVSSQVCAAIAGLLFALTFSAFPTLAAAGVQISGITSDQEGVDIVMGPDATSRAYPNEAKIAAGKPALFIGNQPIDKTVNFVQISKLQAVADCNWPVFVDLAVYRYPDGSSGPVSERELVAKSQYPTLVDNNQQQSRWLTEEPLDLREGGSYGFVAKAVGVAYAIDPENDDEVEHREHCINSPLRITTYPALNPPKPTDRACVPMGVDSLPRPNGAHFQFYRVWTTMQSVTSEQLAATDFGQEDYPLSGNICQFDRKVGEVTGDRWWVAYQYDGLRVPHLIGSASQQSSGNPSVDAVKAEALAPRCETYLRELIGDGLQYDVIDHVKGTFFTEQNGIFGAAALHKCSWASFPPDGSDVDKSGWFWALPNGLGLPGPDGTRPTSTRQILDAKLSGVESYPGMSDPREIHGGINPAAEVPRCNTGDPINCANGNYWEEFTDLSLPGRGAGVSVTRTYNAQAAVPNAAGVAPPPGMFGRGWTSEFEAKVVPSGPATVVVQHGNGSTVPFAKDESIWVAPPWARSTLFKTPSGPYTYTLPNRTRYTFSAATGQLLYVDDERGNRISLTWSGALLTKVAGGGRSISFTHNAAGRIDTATDSAGRLVVYTYSGDNLASVEDVGEATSTFTYDSRGRITKKVDPRGAATRNTYDAQDRVVLQTDAANRSTKLEYLGSPSGSKVKVTDRDGVVTMKVFNHFIPISETRGYGSSKAATVKMAHNERGQLRRLIDPLGAATKYRYDDAGNQTEVEDALGGITRTTFDGLNRPTQTVSPAGRRTRITYDLQGNVTSTVRDSVGDLQGRSEVNLTYDAYGQLLTSTDDSGGVTRFTYDELGNQTKIVTPGGRATTMTYDAAGNVATKTLPAGNVAGANAASHRITYTRNVYGAPVSVKDATGGTTTMGYDATGNLVATTDADGRTTTFGYSLLGRRTSQTRPGGLKDTWLYTGEGHVAYRTDANSETYSFGYDELGRRSSSTDPFSEVTTYEYYADGALKRANAPDGTSVSYGWDKLRRANTVLPRGTAAQPTRGTTTNYWYDPDGYVTEAKNGSEHSVLKWDALGRMWRHYRSNPRDTRGDVGSTSLAYDSAGRLESISYPTGVEYPATSNGARTTAEFGTVSYTYGADGEMTGARGLSGGDYAFVYDANGDLTRANYPGSRAAVYTRDAMGRITNIVTPAGTRGYSYTPAGVRKTASLDGVSNLLTVDGSKHLTAFGARTYSFDAAENPTRTYTELGEPVELMLFGPRPYGYQRPTGATENRTIEHDLQGRRTRDGYTNVGDTLTYTDYVWNELGQLESANFRTRGRGYKWSEFKYGPTGLRNLTSDAFTVKVESWEEGLGENAPMLTQGRRAFVYGPGGMLLEAVGDSGSNPVYQWQDAIGSVIGGTNADTNVTTKLSYDPWGRHLSGTTEDQAVGPFGFAGQVTQPGTNFQYMRARWYDPTTMSFLSVDPKLEQTLQPYLYAGGNPAQYTDPSGESFTDDFANGMIQGLSQDQMQVGSAEGSCSWAYFLGLQAGYNFNPLGKAKKLKELLSFTKGSDEAAKVADEVPLFSQSTASQTFGKGGPFAGRTIGDVANGLRSGAIKPSELPIEVIRRNGEVLAINTRSTLALRRGGIDVSQWKIIDLTGDAAAEEAMTRRLADNGMDGGSDVIRVTGFGRHASSIR